MAKRMIPEIEVWRAREAKRKLQDYIVTLEAKVEGLTAEVSSLRDALDARRQPDTNTRDHSR